MLSIGIIKEWKIVLDPFKEGRPPFVAGKVYGHNYFEDGTDIFTNIIVSSDGREVITASGSCYVLEGNPCIDWMIYCLKKDAQLDIENPFPNLCCKSMPQDLQ